MQILITSHQTQTTYKKYLRTDSISKSLNITILYLSQRYWQLKNFLTANCISETLQKMLNKKHILIGVCGGIAAYKVAYIVRNLIKAGAEVKVIMTETAKSFIGPLTLSTLSKHPVYSDFFDTESGSWSNHVELALWADLFLIAPATSNTIAKMANGICDNLLLATYFSAKNQVAIAPAMDLDMADHPSLLRNISQLENDGVQVIPFAHGELASGLVGNGRMAAPEIFHSFIEDFFSATKDLQKKKDIS